MIEAVVFDLDDTLYAERDYAMSGFAAVAAAFADRLGDRERTVADCRRLFSSPHRTRVFDALLTERGLADNADLAHRMVETYRTHRPTIQLFPDAHAALARLRSKYKLGLITDGRAITQWEKIDGLGLRPRLDEIIVTSELTPAGNADSTETDFSKPHPLAFQQMAKRLRVAYDACCYVADNPSKDFVAPNALGWVTVQVRRHGGLYGELTPAPGGQAHHVIEDLAELDARLC